MKRSVINGIGWAAKGYESYELQAFGGTPRPSSPAEPDRLEELLKSIGVDTEMENEIFEEVLDRGTKSEMQGFRNGFRLAVRLMTECLAAPEEGEST